ncbi:hypothetical protein [Intrasporangium sp. YIM S08009]|uniref:hypothetical protein n=1 Tax=Intrasporangium zincisolvens TaxID=3080018 RepID=UPI002B0558BA|nr:hypothetical protein [Intrasporangium sp. YIM S08009]
MSAPTPVPTRDAYGGIVDGLGRAALVVAAVVVAVAVGLLGTHPTPLSELRTAIASGQVHDLRVAGTLPEGASGFATAYVRWSAGGFDRLTTVRQVSSPDQGEGARSDVVVGSIEQHLREVQGAGVLRIVHDESARPTGGSMVGIELPSWVVGGALLVWVLSLLLLVMGPEPSRATRWGWFWLLVSTFAPLTTVLFLVLGEPAQRRSGEPGRRRRFGGGRAFVLMLLVGGFVWSQR